MTPEQAQTLITATTDLTGYVQFACQLLEVGLFGVALVVGYLFGKGKF